MTAVPMRARHVPPPPGLQQMAAFMMLVNAAVRLTPPPPPPQWLTLDEASRYLGLSLSLVKRIVRGRQLPSVRDRSIKVRRVDLDNLDIPAALSGLQAAAADLRSAVKARRV